MTLCRKIDKIKENGRGEIMFSYEQIQSLNELEMEVYNYVILHLKQVSTMM